jgi:hypothetical protein
MVDQRNDKNGNGDEESGTCGQPIQAVNQIKSVGYGEDPEDRRDEAPQGALDFIPN